MCALLHWQRPMSRAGDGCAAGACSLSWMSCACSLSWMSWMCLLFKLNVLALWVEWVECACSLSWMCLLFELNELNERCSLFELNASALALPDPWNEGTGPLQFAFACPITFGTCLEPSKSNASSFCRPVSPTCPTWVSLCVDGTCLPSAALLFSTSSASTSSTSTSSTCTSSASTSSTSTSGKNSACGLVASCPSNI